MSSKTSALWERAMALLETRTPLLDQQAMGLFVAKYFERGRRFLDNLDPDLLPVYVLDRGALSHRARQFKDAFSRVFDPVSFYYAVKSNNCSGISEILLENGFGLDVSSGVELEMALALGAKDIVFSGPGKTEKELALAASHSESVVVLADSFTELERLEKTAASCNRMVSIGVRLTTQPTGLWRKFGILPEALADFAARTAKCPHIRMRGLQFHTSWSLDPGNQVAFIEQLGEILRRLQPSLRKRIEFVDIGGGYWPEAGEWLQPAGTPEGKLRDALGEPPGPPMRHHGLGATPITVFAQTIGEAVLKHLQPLLSARICLEPGRWISNDAMHLFIRVLDKKGPDLVITDAGTNAVGWERFETDYFPVLNLSRPALTEKPCHVLGSLCTPHDVWGYSYWGSGIEIGDILMVPTQGAYTYSLRQHFIKPLPEVVVF